MTTQPEPQNPQKEQMDPSSTAPASVTVNAPQPVKIVFYCKDCDKLVTAVKIGNKYVYKCPICSTKNVAFGTEKSIKSYYHLAR